MSRNGKPNPDMVRYATQLKDGQGKVLDSCNIGFPEWWVRRSFVGRYHEDGGSSQFLVLLLPLTKNERKIRVLMFI